MASPLTRPKNIPDSPGCYLFRDANGRVIYVGKAKSLRSRLSSYFQAPYLLHPRTASMVEQAADVEWIVTKNEVESLHLEYNLIKKNSPRFNVRYKDDKSYPYLAITVGEEYPRATVMRGGSRKRWQGALASTLLTCSRHSKTRWSACARRATRWLRRPRRTAHP